MTHDRSKRTFVPVLLLLFILLALPATQLAGSNVLVRFATTVRLVDNGTVELGEYATKTNDVAEWEGRYYLDKAPGVSLLLVPAYVLVRLFTDDFNTARHLSRLLTLLPLALLACFLLWRLLPRWEVDDPTRAIAVVTFAVGTIGWPYFSMLYSHGFAMALILIGTLALVEYRYRRDRTHWLWVAGACFGVAIAFEFPVALLGAVAGIYLLSFERKIGRILGFAALGLVPPALLIGGFQYAAFGDPLHFGYFSERFQHYSEGMSQGFMGIGWPSMENLELLLLSPAKGLFFWNPVLHVGLIGIILLVRHRRRDGLLLAGLVVSYCLLLSGYYEAGGAACLGPRHLAPIVGPLIIAAAWLAAKTGLVGRGIFLGLAVVSSLLMAVGVFSEPQMPDRIANPLWEFAMPLLLEGVGPGNLLELPDGVVSIAALVVLAVTWIVATWPSDTQAIWRQKMFRWGALGAAALALGFYLFITPHIAVTEPGMLHQVKGNHFNQRGDYERAAAEYEAAFITRKDPWILYYQAQALSRLGQQGQAEQVIQKLILMDPSFFPQLVDDPVENSP